MIELFEVLRVDWIGGVERSSENMRGSIGLQRNERSWAFLGIGQKYCAEVKSGDERVTIRWTQLLLRRETRYELIDSNGTLHECFLVMEGTGYRMNLSFGKDDFLEYQLDFFGRVLFKTRDSEISTLTKVEGRKRSFAIDGMRFEHSDFQSEMRFECPKERFYQAALVANLLFNPPLQNQNS